ncbi:MAG TPA: DNA-deoxyinosine glycosylase [Stellaceae bacterium]|nr:DNA-deoxyinosine glycosylase [Stellaceae bacterium]
MRADHAVAPAGARPDRGAPRALRRLSALPATPPKRSFSPVLGANPRVLVLGTLPSEESLRRVEYYAHPRNLFWPIVFGLFGERSAPIYADRLAFVMARRIALWDVCAMAERRASLDSEIRREVPNTLHDLLDANPTIATVAFNGGGARRLYDRHFKRRPGLVYLHLPSTSPAHASLGFPEKLARWQALRDAIEA